MKCGHVAVVGKPNAGKSTLINSFLQRKLNITSPKRNTTHHCVRGVYSDEDRQIIFMDTPGVCERPKTLLEKHIGRSAVVVMEQVDAVLMLSEGTVWNSEDEYVLSHRRDGIPWVLAINKMDRMGDKEKLLPHLSKLGELQAFTDMVPVCARRGLGLQQLQSVLDKHLPESPLHFDTEVWTDRSEQFMAAEIVREQLLRQLGDEVPYSCTAKVAGYVRQDDGVRKINVDIWVQRPSQKAIIIGKSGSRLQTIGSRARLIMQNYFDAPVILKTWVKVVPGWRENAGLLKELGFGE